LTRDRAGELVNRYSERKEAAEALEARLSLGKAL